VNEIVKALHTSDFQQQELSLLEKIAANIPGMIFQFLQRQDGSQSVLYASSGCRELYELEPEVVQKDFQVLYKLIHPEDTKAFAESVANSCATLEPWHWEGRIITPSGKLKWVQAASRPDKQANGDMVWDGLLMDITDRKLAEEKLRQSEARYKAILHAIPDMMFRISRDGEYLDFKGEGALEDIVGKSLRDILPPDVACINQEAIAKTLDANTLQTCEYQLPTPSGMRDYEARLVKSGEDEVLAIVRDITERKQSEAAVQHLAQKFSKAFRCSPDPITISTLKEGRYIEVNDSFVQLTGYERSEAIGRTAFELNIWVNESDRAKLLQKLELEGAIRNYELEFRKKSGEVILVQLSAEVIDLDGIPCLLAVSHDITERKQAEKLLHLSSQRDRLLAETLVRIRQSLNLNQILQTTVNEVRQFLQVDRVFVAVNDTHTLCRIIAESVDPKYPSVLESKICDRTLLQELKTQLVTNRVRLVEDITQMTVSPKLAALYQQFQTRASLAVPIMLGKELFGALIVNSCSEPRHWQQMEIDLLQQMSEQLAIAIQQAQLYQELEQLNTNLERQVEERTAQLQQKMQELQEINRVKDVVLHTISHDLRTAVIGNLMVLQNMLKSEGLGHKDNSPLSSPSPHCPLSSQSGGLPFPISPSFLSVPRSIIERMIQGNDRQLLMIDSLLEIHSSEVEGIILHREVVKFNTLLETIFKEVEPMLVQNQAQLKILVPEDLPLVFADAAKLHKVFVNLFTHVLQNNPPGLNLKLSAKVEADMIRCTIQHNGTPMSKLECDRLFELQVRDPQARFSTCIGLKMYLCQQIIKAHGGEISVISNRKCGVTFWLTLPLAT
jgi:PAS domain S-box-containing protein